MPIRRMLILTPGKTIPEPNLIPMILVLIMQVKSPGKSGFQKIRHGILTFPLSLLFPVPFQE